jgi:acetolactate synthase-1/2/3 large subunit
MTASPATWPFRPLDAKVIHVEIDPSEIDKNVATSVAINADVAEALKLLENDPGLIVQAPRHWFDQIDYRGERLPCQIKAEVAAASARRGNC